MLVINKFSKSNDGKERIIYAITPPPGLRNIGDQAQVVAIRDWMQKHWPNKEVIELNKDEVITCIKYFKNKIRSQDTIILHSGGNLGDRGIWSERARRTMISNFGDNKIVSLPQTINFHDTDNGRKELTISKDIYNIHRDLTIIARDHQSYKLAQDYFPNCKTDEAPDFVLSYNVDHLNLGKSNTNGKVLFCLREDDESAINKDMRNKLLNSVGMEYDIFDTTIAEPISESNRKKILDETLVMFSKYDMIITDRFHGLIFSVLCKKPTVVLSTVDHKLTSAFDWFDNINYVKFAHSIDDVKKNIDVLEKIETFNNVDWHSLHFNKIAELTKG
ncbi:hypothetical protein BOO35_18860 [Vibrio navarrensis]|nr:hypothetical protein [Vibrio navarrensis]